jgi:hypothetical protein
MKIVICETRQPNIDRDKWIYPWKEYTGVASVFFSAQMYRFCDHRVPWFLSLHAHLAIEHILEGLWNLLFIQFPFKNLLFVYDALHGVICSRNMNEILEWWNARKEDGTMSEVQSDFEHK